MERRRNSLHFIIILILILVFYLSSPSRSEESLESKQDYSFLDKWSDIQTYMNRKGFIFETINTLDVLSNVSGGLRQRTAFAGDFDMLLTIDGERLLHWKEATFFVYGLGIYGENPSENVGNFQGVSSIAAPNQWKLFELWFEKDFLDHRYSLLGGLYDVTSEFDVVRVASEIFLNSSFGTGGEFSASGRNGPPTFPNTALGIRGQAFITENTAFRATVTDGDPGDPDNNTGTEISLKGDDGIFAMGEFAYYIDKVRANELVKKDVLKERPLRLVFQRVGRAAPVEYDGKYAVGIWGYTTPLSDITEIDDDGNPVIRNGTFGIYGLAEQQVFLENQHDDQGLDLFANIGFADPKVNRFSQFYGGGLVYTGLIPGRDYDSAGIGVAATLIGDHFRQAQESKGLTVDDEEVALEVTYAINFSPNFVIQPDLQYIINPDTDPSVPNALVLGARIQINLSWFERLSTNEAKQP